MNLDFNKYADQLMPVVIQDSQTQKVLMVGFMNEAALEQTKAEGKVVFYSRSKQRLWMKGETSGNFLHTEDLLQDCDNDCLLIKVRPTGPVCHTGTDTCFGEDNKQADFLHTLEQIIAGRKEQPDASSYTSLLFQKGINKIAQKVGEEAVELVIEAKDNNDELFKNEAADLLFHYLILLQAKGFKLADIKEVLSKRHKQE